MKLSKKLLRGVFSLTLTAVVFANSALAEAADFKAGNLSELAQIVRTQGMQKKTGFTVEYTGNEADIDYVMNEDSDFFYTDLALLDDASTTDDADYIVGNINFSVDDWISASGNDILFNYPYFESTDQTQFVDEKTPQILADLNIEGMTNYNKVKTIHDYVCNLITYTDDADNCSSVYSAYSTGQGLCNSYSLCMYKLLVTAGIPCKWIGGKAGTGRDAGGHAWNIVALGDKWYNLDATWDDNDSENTYNYDYFLKGNSDFDSADPSQVHTPDNPYLKEAFTSKFPMADTAFNPETDNDANSSATAGADISKPAANTGSDPGAAQQTATTPTQTSAATQDAVSAPAPSSYSYADVIEGRYPYNGKFKIKRKKSKELQLFITNETMAQLINKVSYKVTTGKKRVKIVKNYGVLSDDEGYFTSLKIKGKKKGSVKIKITLTLTNGQKFNTTFSGKIK